MIRDTIFDTLFEEIKILITELFGQLKDNPTGHAFSVLPFPGRKIIYLAIDSLTRPSLFIRTSDLSIEPTLRSARVSLRLGQNYAVAPTGEPVRVERFHALCCETSEATEISTFLVLVEAFLAQYADDQLNRETIVSFFRSMSRLFSAGPVTDLRAERQGLWGELFVMSRIFGFVFWAPFWRSEITRKFDFTSDRKHVEVKTVLGDVRIHHFAHRQVYELEDEQTMIASLLLRKDDSGLSLRELIDQTRAALLGSDQYFKLEQSVRYAGMETESSGPTFDPLEAEKSLAWYRAADAPHFKMPEPPGVSQTHYRVDLALAPQVSKSELNLWLQTWAPHPQSAEEQPNPVVL